jgi:hypothetical protein
MAENEAFPGYGQPLPSNAVRKQPAEPEARRSNAGTCGIMALGSRNSDEDRESCRIIYAWRQFYGQVLVQNQRAFGLLINVRDQLKV